MLALIRNEVLKILLKKKMPLIMILLLIFVGLLSYGQNYSYERNIEQFEAESGETAFNWQGLTT